MALPPGQSKQEEQRPMENRIHAWLSRGSVPGGRPQEFSGVSSMCHWLFIFPLYDGQQGLMG
jgi:hypothetical protein